MASSWGKVEKTKPTQTASNVEFELCDKFGEDKNDLSHQPLLRKLSTVNLFLYSTLIR